MRRTMVHAFPDGTEKWLVRAARVSGAGDPRRRRKLLALKAALTFMGFGPPVIAQGALMAPSYVVVSSGLTTDQAAALGQALGVPVDGQIADGLTSSSGDSTVIPSVGNQPIPGPDPSNRTVGIEYQSWSVGLWGSETGSQQLVTGVAAAVPSVSRKFVAAELMSWETDFRSDLLVGGQDLHWVDNVDLACYNGHGGPGGFGFSSMRDSTSISTAGGLRLGDRDLEWLALDTCLVLNNDDGKVLSRLQPVFRGLHIVLGFDTISEDTSELGGIFADYMFGTATNPYSHSYGAHLTLVQAWALAVIITNHDGKVWAAMGPYGKFGISDVSDRFFGFGNVGADIRGTDIKGYWRLSGPA